VNVVRAEAAFWAAFLRNRNIDQATAGDGAVAVAGGYALYAAGTCLDHAIGAGSTRPLTAADLEVVRAFYAARGASARLELDETVVRRDRPLLAAEGFADEGTEHVVLEAPTSVQPQRDGFAVRQTSDRRAWTQLVVRAGGDTIAEGEHDRLLRAVQSAASAAHGLFIATLEGVEVGGGALGITGDLGLLYAAAVLPAYRGRGAHRALLVARLAFARTRGATRAALKASAGSPAERSATALGFARTASRRRLRSA
jgi:GNAT superfamily N-acetyltransferase